MKNHEKSLKMPKKFIRKLENIDYIPNVHIFLHLELLKINLELMEPINKQLKHPQS